MTPADHVIVLFGATGDLARRKLLPGLFRLDQAGLMPERYRIVGTSRAALDHDGFRRFAREALAEFGASLNGEWDAFARKLSYSDADEEAPALAATIDLAECDLGAAPRRLHYLSVPPVAAPGIVETLRRTGLAQRARMILEKPFGTDLPSARGLNETVHAVFDESQVFRIDHFLGKETVQNLLALRFGNGVYESVWNRAHIAHVQIDVPETLSVGGRRAAFYEETGAFRDMVVTHLFQVLGFVAMEPPTSFSAKALLDETVKVFQAMAPLRPQDMVRGQYAGYRDEPGVAHDSQTETFVALRARIENWRWAGVPFYLRTGKRMAESRRLLTVTFRDPPRRMFDSVEGHGPNQVVFDLGDRGGISASFLAKVPGPTMRLAPARFRFDYDESFAGAHELEAYERLIHDALLGDRTLFTRADGIERLWEVSAPVLEHRPPVVRYEPGSWGPAGIDALMAPDRWHLPEPA
jgi:glucose-6-phosphate 1-dehydrogenase